MKNKVSGPSKEMKNSKSEEQAEVEIALRSSFEIPKVEAPKDFFDERPDFEMDTEKSDSAIDDVVSNGTWHPSSYISPERKLKNTPNHARGV